MSNNFEKWWLEFVENFEIESDEYDMFLAKKTWEAATKEIQESLEKKDKELEVLRRFACEVLDGSYGILRTAKKYGLVDESEKKTKLLTGD